MPAHPWLSFSYWYFTLSYCSVILLYYYLICITLVILLIYDLASLDVIYGLHNEFASFCSILFCSFHAFLCLREAGSHISFLYQCLTHEDTCTSRIQRSYFTGQKMRIFTVIWLPLLRMICPTFQRPTSTR